MYRKLIPKRALGFLLAALLLLSLMMTVSAATYTTGDNVPIYQDFCTIFKLKERDAAGFPWMATKYCCAAENGNTIQTDGDWLYCIDYYEHAKHGLVNAKATALDETPQWTTLSIAAQRGITHALIYGGTNYSNEIHGYAATQLIIWEYQLGKRTVPTESVSFFAATLAQNTRLRSCYDGILALMAKHDLPPSFSGSEIVLSGFGRDYGVTLTDTTGQLANDAWQVVSGGNGIVVEQNGNSLFIYATEAAGANAEINLRLQRNLKVATGNAVCALTGTQQVLIGVPPDPVVAQLKVKTQATADLEIVKTSSDGKVAGIRFQAERWVSGIGYCSVGAYTTDAAGNIRIPSLTVGDKYRITETVPENYTAEQRIQEITIQAGKNVLHFVNHCKLADLEIVKASDDGNISGIEFYAEQWVSDSYKSIGSYTTDADGKIVLPSLHVGDKYRFREVVPEGYTAEQAEQEITVKEGNNTLTFVNRRRRGSISAWKKDAAGAPLAGVTFLLEYSENGAWTPVQYVSGGGADGSCTSAGLSDGRLTTGSDGKVVFSGLCLNVPYRLTEVRTQDGKLLLTMPLYEDVLPLDDMPDVYVTAINNTQILLPMTGGTGHTLVSLGAALMVLAAGMGVFLLHRKNKKTS